MSTWKPIVMWLLMCCAIMLAETAPKATLTVETAYVEESRSTQKMNNWKNRCEVGLLFSGPEIVGAVDITRVTINTASDDTGKNLIRNCVNVGSRVRDANPRLPCGRLTFRLDLQEPDRSAKKIRQIAGEVTVFVPQADDTVTIRDLRKDPGRLISATLLVKHKVRIAYLDKSLLEKPKKELLAKLENQFEESDLNVLSEVESLPRLDSRYVYFLMKDPEKRVMQWHFVDGAGRILPGETRSIGSVRIYRPGKRVQDPLYLRICFFTENGVKRLPFDIRDINLP